MAPSKTNLPRTACAGPATTHALGALATIFEQIRSVLAACFPGTIRADGTANLPTQQDRIGVGVRHCPFPFQRISRGDPGVPIWNRT